MFFLFLAGISFYFIIIIIIISKSRDFMIDD